MLADQLVAAYKSDEPDIVSLVIRAHDFADLIEQFELAKRVHERNGEIVARVHAARDETHRQAVMLAELEEERRDTRRGDRSAAATRSPACAPRSASARPRSGACARPARRRSPARAPVGPRPRRR